MATNDNIVQSFFETAQAEPDLLAISAGNQEISYGDLAAHAGRLAAHLQPKLTSGRVGILASRSIAAYVGIVGAAWAGATYVPLNMKWPAERLIQLMGDLELDALVIDSNGAKLLTDEVRAAAPSTIISGDPIHPIEGYVDVARLSEPALQAPVPRQGADLAYIVFTSGSTGMPKGVMVSCDSLARYLDESQKWTQLTAADRIAEAHDVTFDLSVHNMFLAWRAGSSLHLMTALDMMAPQAFVRKRAITVWMSVPTIVNNMRRAGSLKPGLFDTLRLSIFCGEPLAMPTVEAWQEAAPQSVIENIYGPTECTVVCMRQRLTQPPLVTRERGILSIGDAYENFDIRICDPSGAQVPTNEIGEIVLGSDQLADGYFNRPDLTDAAFRMVDGRRWYFTGDLGYRDENDKFHHMGRLDNQVKMKGNRIELEEVETHLRRACGTELAVVVAWPVIDGSAQGLVGFSTNMTLSEKEVRAEMAKALPEYMVPGRIEFRAEMPRNINDKIDRKALIAELEGNAQAPSMVTPVAAGQDVTA
ncbi:MAG: AMP-binding protein [Rhizobiaceae bacterium]|nr:AMP-binding protein [Hyphomicrobiales bacterium]NRB30835.1 AMP-binding protein [Rhizobiaceae bacterium]